MNSLFIVCRAEITYRKSRTICSFPLQLSFSGKSDGPEASLRASSGCARDSAARSAAHIFIAVGSSLSNALFRGRGTTTEALCTFYLRVQLQMTGRMHQCQVAH